MAVMVKILIVSVKGGSLEPRTVFPNDIIPTKLKILATYDDVCIGSGQLSEQKKAEIEARDKYLAENPDALHTWRFKTPNNPR